MNKLTFEQLTVSRISAKLSQGNNYRNYIRFLVNYLDEASTLVNVLQDMRNIDTTNEWVLEQIGHILGVTRPRWHLNNSTSGAFQWDITGWDTVPFVGEAKSKTYPVRTELFRRYLRMVASMKRFSGTVDEYENSFKLLTGTDVYINNLVDTPTVFISGHHSVQDMSFYVEIIRHHHNLTTEFVMTTQKP